MLATSWTPDDPQYHHRGGGEGYRNQARERVECRPGKGGLEVKALLGLFAGGRENRPPFSAGRNREAAMFTQLYGFFMWVPQAVSRSQALN